MKILIERIVRFSRGSPLNTTYSRKAMADQVRTAGGIKRLKATSLRLSIGAVERPFESLVLEGFPSVI
jgi:hypothetical protein